MTYPFYLIYCIYADRRGRLSLLYDTDFVCKKHYLLLSPYVEGLGMKLFLNGINNLLTRQPVNSSTLPNHNFEL